MTAIRLAPSGPVIANASGGPFAPGPGAQLRLTEAQTTVGASNVIPTAANYAASVTLDNALAGPGLIVTLANPNSLLGYRAVVKCDVLNPSTNGAGEVQLYLETSLDAGATWQELASNTHLVEPSTAGGTARQIELTQVLKGGLAIGVASPPQASIKLRARIGATSGGNVLVVESPITPGGDTFSRGTVLLQLFECF